MHNWKQKEKLHSKKRYTYSDVIQRIVTLALQNRCFPKEEGDISISKVVVIDRMKVIYGDVIIHPEAYYFEIEYSDWLGSVVKTWARIGKVYF